MIRRHTRPHRSPFVVGLLGTLGGLIALLLALIVSSLATVLTYVGLALFIAIGLDPLLVRLQRRGVRRPVGVAIIFVVALVLTAAAVVFLVPPLVHQLVGFVRAAPAALRDITSQAWYITLNSSVGETIDLDAVASWVRSATNDPSFWAAATGGLLKVGAGVIGGVVGTVTVLILSIFFLASLPTIKQGLVSLVAQRSRERFGDLAEQIFASIGGYLNGMIVLAFANAALGFIAMLAFGVPFAGVLAVIVFFVTLIPLVGSVIAAVLVVVVGLFNSPGTAIGIGIYYLVYMQLEAYVLTPRVMNKTVDVPGSLVVIGALAGGTLLGALGALVAIPVTAAILLIVKQVWIPRQDLRV